jgi:hypothetical protein
VRGGQRGSCSGEGGAAPPPPEVGPVVEHQPLQLAQQLGLADQGHEGGRADGAAGRERAGALAARATARWRRTARRQQARGLVAARAAAGAASAPGAERRRRRRPRRHRRGAGRGRAGDRGGRAAAAAAASPRRQRRGVAPAALLRQQVRQRPLRPAGGLHARPGRQEPAPRARPLHFPPRAARNGRDRWFWPARTRRDRLGAPGRGRRWGRPGFVGARLAQPAPPPDGRPSALLAPCPAPPLPRPVCLGTLPAPRLAPCFYTRPGRPPAGGARPQGPLPQGASVPPRPLRTHTA